MVLYMYVGYVVKEKKVMHAGLLFEHRECILEGQRVHNVIQM